MSHQDIERTFDLLASPTGCVHWTAKHPIHRAAAGSYACNSERLATVVKQQAGWDFYVSLNPTQNCRKAKPPKDAVVALSCIGIDIDPFPGQRLDLARVGEQLNGMTKELLRTSDSHLLISSGRGLWLWIMLHPVAIVEGHFSVNDADTLVKAVTQWYVDNGGTLRSMGIIDTASAEVSRIARCPGTVNTRTKAISYILQDRIPISRYSVESLKHLVPPYLSRFDEPLQIEELGLEASTIAHVAPALNVTSRTFLLCGVDTLTESRHRRLHSTAKNMQELGLKRDDAAVLLALGASRCRPNLLKTDPGFLDTVLKQVWPTT